MIEPASFIAPIVTALRWLFALRNKNKIHIQRKANDDEFAFFYVVFKPAYRGQTLWAKVAMNGKRERVFVFWPTGDFFARGLPWGVEGDGTKSCYCRLIAKPHALAEIANGNTVYRLTSDEKYEAVAWSRYGSEEVRAGFAVKVQSASKQRFRFVNPDLVNIEVIDEHAKKIAARSMHISKL